MEPNGERLNKRVREKRGLDVKLVQSNDNDQRGMESGNCTKRKMKLREYRMSKEYTQKC